MDDAYWGETHNDFMELATETGLIGLTVLMCVFATLGTSLLAALKAIPAKMIALASALVAMIAAVAFEELFDFGRNADRTHESFEVSFDRGHRGSVSSFRSVAEAVEPSVKGTSDAR
jgi:O-antigen ligase